MIAPDGSVQLQCARQDEQVHVAVDAGTAADDPVDYLAQVPERMPVAISDPVTGGTT